MLKEGDLVRFIKRGSNYEDSNKFGEVGQLGIVTHDQTAYSNVTVRPLRKMKRQYREDNPDVGFPNINPNNLEKL